MNFYHRCWTGRRWLMFGRSGIGFGPIRFIERIHWRGQLVWLHVPAYHMYQAQAVMYEKLKDERQDREARERGVTA